MRHYRTEPSEELPYWVARGWRLVAHVPYHSGCSVLLWREEPLRDDAKGGSE